MTDLVIRALQFAAEKHRHQRRKDAETSPYINHPVDVLSILALESGIDDPVVLCAALLHDTLEDTDTTLEELQQAFGDPIAAVVFELTDDQSLPRPERYASQLRKAPFYSMPARLVRIADKIANTRDATRSPPPAWTIERLEGHFRQSSQVMDRIRNTHAGMERLFDQAFDDAMKCVARLRHS